MAKLLAEIERHLRRVQRIASTQVVDADVWPDLARHEAHLVATYQRLADSVPEGAAHLARELDSRWSPRQLERFVDEVHWELLAGFGATLTGQERAELINTAIELVENRAISPPTFRASRVLTLARSIEPRTNEYSWHVSSQYCERLGLVSERPRVPRLHIAGETWLRLRGVDRLRWLLALEGECAGDDDDEWCIGTSQVDTLVHHAGRTFFRDDESDYEGPHWSGVRRWSELGAVQTWEEFDFDSEEYTFGYKLTEIGEQLFAPANADLLAMFRDLAKAQSEDDRSEILQTFGVTEPSSQIAATTMRHARLVAHEVRNALLPVRYALKKVWKALDGNPLAAALTEPREQIDEGITRLYRFVEASARMSAPVEDRPVRFAILDAIEEARRELTELSGRVRIETNPGTASPSVIGHQGRVVLALINIMRNAVQAAGPTVEIWITVDSTVPGVVKVMIEDDGPGVPDAIRGRLFENGTSSHTDGSGHGLALVREVIEQELGGTVTYAPSDRGARFQIELPSAQEPASP
jgi:signal transduction histidine kinase